MSDDDSPARHGNLDMKVEWRAVAVMTMMGRDDDDLAADDLATEALQPLDELPNPRLEGWRSLHVTESDL